MGVKVTATRHGYIGFRIFWKGRRAEFAVKTKDDGARGSNRRFFEAKAVLIEEDLKRGRALHLALVEHLGDCPPRLVPGHEREKRRRSDITFRTYYKEWFPRIVPQVTASTATRYRRSWNGVLLPLIGDIPLRDFHAAELRELRAKLAAPVVKVSKHGKVHTVVRKPKTLRNIIDWHLKALWKDALDVDEIVRHNPFPRLKWKKQRSTKPDPFEPAERERIIAWYAQHEPFWHPFVVWQFWTGMRPGETAALRYGDLDLEAGKVAIAKSRDEKEEGPPKTTKSERTIDLLPQVITALEDRPTPISTEPDKYVFVTPEDKPVTDSWWPKRGWYRCLKALKIRPRKFYAARHTFISTALAAGVNVSEVADYCGTSVTMIDRHYGRWIKRERSLSALRKVSAAQKEKVGA